MPPILIILSMDEKNTSPFSKGMEMSINWLKHTRLARIVLAHNLCALTGYLVHNPLQRP
jgi:hypothetical protein